MTTLLGTRDPAAHIPGAARYDRAADGLGHLNAIRDALLAKLRPEVETLLREARAIDHGKLSLEMELNDCMDAIRDQLGEATWHARAYLEQAMEEAS